MTDDSKCAARLKAFETSRRKPAESIFLLATRSQRSSQREIDLAPIFQAIEEDLKSQYLLGFYISESSKDNRKHVFSVTLKPKDIEYSVGRLGYSRMHKFMINLPHWLKTTS